MDYISKGENKQTFMINNVIQTCLHISASVKYFIASRINHLKPILSISWVFVFTKIVKIYIAIFKGISCSQNLLKISIRTFTRPWLAEVFYLNTIQQLFQFVEQNFQSKILYSNCNAGDHLLSIQNMTYKVFQKYIYVPVFSFKKILSLNMIKS